MSADEDLGLVYLPVSTPTNDFFWAGAALVIISLPIVWFVSGLHPAKEYGITN